MQNRCRKLCIRDNMLGKSHFYHEAIKRAVSVFGTMFNEIDIQRDNANGSTTQNVRVPLAYDLNKNLLQD